MQCITIGYLPDISLKKVGVIYFSSFGSLWLILEPLSFFGVFPDAQKIGWVGYASLVVISLFISVTICQLWRAVQFKRLKFVSVVMESSLEGSFYKVKSPATLQVWDFSHLFIEHLQKGKTSQRAKWIS